MQEHGIDDCVAVFGDNGTIQKLAASVEVQPPTWPDPYDNDELLQLAKQGNVVALVVCDLHSRFSDSRPKTFQRAVKTAGELLSDMQKLAAVATGGPRSVMTGWSVPRSGSDPARYSKLIDQAGVVGQIWPGEIAGIPNKPGPLSSMLVLGALGAGAGKLTGKVLGRTGMFDPETVENRATMIGGLAGLLPGAAYAGLNMLGGKPALTGKIMAVPRRKLGMLDPAYFGRQDLIPVERLQQMIWEDPDVAGRLPVSVAAATSALVEGASRQVPRETPFITPVDVARLAVGMGSGYASGLLVGKALGGLFGVSDTAQQVLRQSGAAAGIIRTFVPLAFRG